MTVTGLHDAAGYIYAFEAIRSAGRLALQRVDDDADFFAPLLRRQDLPEGLRADLENAPAGPGKTAARAYVELAVPSGDATRRDAVSRWLAAELRPDLEHVLAWERVRLRPDADPSREVGWRGYYLWRRVELGGDAVRDASVVEGANGTPPTVAVTLDTHGGELFLALTAASVKRRIAIVVDGLVVAAPIVQEKIGGGRLHITLGASAARAEADDLVQALRSGALPIPLVLATERLVGP